MTPPSRPSDGHRAVSRTEGVRATNAEPAGAADGPGSSSDAAGLEPPAPPGALADAAAQDGRGPDGGLVDGQLVEELTDRLPASELVKIIKNALECGRRNVPFTERELWQATALGSSFAAERGASRGSRTGLRRR